MGERKTVIVVDFSGELPDDVDIIDGSIDLLDDEDRADTLRMLAEMKARGEKVERWTLGGPPKPRDDGQPADDDKMNWTTADGLTIDDSEGEGEPFDFSVDEDDEVPEDQPGTEPPKR
ncbi:hypothetical protein A33M_2907 [Rhodovulum sp. PH10]|uniref:hypothetical protein n=1 Tax=Rhodovulum sp. PH10 TaxID=1187851 RepID=UPI00027C2B43|nr:hypothetical protein [Rhodovulum sp. PH10]EJW11710.1 hypothetical protein A33M_2907 [Rhodovulum sp. PH10]